MTQIPSQTAGQNPLLDPTATDAEVGSDVVLRPTCLAEFAGQDALKANLQIFIQSARQEARALDHTLFFGPPGLGKTTVSQLIATELGVGFRATSGPIISKAGDLAAILTNLQPRDVLFIDEIHRLNPVVEEVLYPAMEDFQLDLLIGSGPAARTVRIDLPPFTLVGATTRLGLLSMPLRDRFGIQERLNVYDPEVLQVIVQRGADKLGLVMTEEASFEIASRARGTPRIAGRLLRRVRDFAIVENEGRVGRDLANRALNRLDVDQSGLDAMDRRYLRLIADHYGGGPVGVETLGAALSEESDAIEDVIEPFLMQQGFVQRTSRGRLLTDRAYAHLDLPRPTQDEEADQFNLLNSGEGR